MAGKGGKMPGAGRPKGSVNKTTADAKAAIERVYAAIGGDTSFEEWAKENKSIFYQHLFKALLPKDINTTIRHVTDADQLSDDQLAYIATGAGGDIAEAEPAPDKSQLN
jgi:hypothetical protein